VALVVDLQRGPRRTEINHDPVLTGTRHIHLAQNNRLLLSSCRIDFHNCQWCPNAQSAIKDIHAKDNRVPLGENCNNLQSTRPNSLRRSVFSLSLDDLRVVRREGVEQVVDDISCSCISTQTISEWTTETYL